MSAALADYKWQPGQSGNPGGRSRLSEELRQIKALSQPEVARFIAKYARMTQADVEKVVLNKKMPMLEACIASVFAKCVELGDFTRLSFLLDRAIGKIPVAVEDDEDRAARKMIEDLSDEELFRLVAEKIPVIKKAG